MIYLEEPAILYIEATTFKAKTAQFGELQVKLADVRSLPAEGVSDPGGAAVAGVQADPGSLTGFQGFIGQKFAFTVTGRADGSIFGTDVYTTDSCAGHGSLSSMLRHPPCGPDRDGEGADHPVAARIRCLHQRRDQQCLGTVSRGVSDPQKVTAITIGPVCWLLAHFRRRRVCGVAPVGVFYAGTIPARSLCLFSRPRVMPPGYGTPDGHRCGACFCHLCQKKVYNLSAMTRGEGERLLAKSEGNMCVCMYRRQDGTVMTTDCPVGVRRCRWRQSGRPPSSRLFSLAALPRWGAAVAGIKLGVLTTDVNGRSRP